MSMEISDLYEFAEFRLDATRRLLFREGETVHINSKAFETLLLLVRNCQRVMVKDELLAALWPETFVEEVNLAQNISALRKALGELPGENRFIATIPGKGYQFVCEVRESRSAASAPGIIASTAGAVPAGTAEPEGREPKTIPTSAGPVRRRWIAAASLMLILLAAGTATAWWYIRRNQEPTHHSIAVLPFQPLIAGTDQEHLGLGMADAVITRLSGIHQLPVGPTDVVIRYDDPKVDPLQAAREMGVDTVLTGKTQKSGDRVRVTVQMVRVSDGRVLWARTFDQSYNGIFAVEDSISEEVAQALALNLAEEEKQQLQRHYTDNIDAYRNYLQGRYAEFTFTREGMNNAIRYFNNAIADDPGYALAYAGLADAWTTESDWLIAPREALPKAETSARKAILFDDRLAEAHGALAHALLHEWRLAESDREFHTALALNPSNVSTYFAYSEYLMSVGHFDQAIGTMQKALTIDPLSPEINAFLAWDYYLKRDYPSCLATSRKLQMFPGSGCRTPLPPCATTSLRSSSRRWRKTGSRSP